MELGAIAEVLAPGQVSVELLPHPDRLVDTANQYHVWALQPGCFDELSGSAQWDRPPALGDWRALYDWKERLHPGREGALVLAGDSTHRGLVLIAPPGARFPFGFQERAILAEGVGGAVQRPFEHGEESAC